MAMPQPPAAAAGFATYLNSRTLPARLAETRQIGGCHLTWVEHAPCHGIEYAPVDALIISVVLKPKRQPVIRQLAQQELRFLDSAGQILLTPPKNPSWWRFDSNPQVLHLSLPRAAVSELLGLSASVAGQHLEQAARRIHNAPVVTHLATQLWVAAQRPNSYTQRHARPTLLALLATLLDSANEAAPATKPAPALAPWRVQKAVAWMRQAGPDFSVAELAAHLGLSPDHFRRAFKAATGQSPYQLMSALRIDQAKGWLETTNRPLTELATELGFASSAHFSARFRQLVGESPSQWRAQRQNQNGRLGQ